jgi:hypothetical protein
MANPAYQNDIRYPDITVKLSDQDGNAFIVMALVGKALRTGLRDRLSPNEIKGEVDEYMQESMSGDYDHLLQVAMRWVNVE